MEPPSPGGISVPITVAKMRIRVDARIILRFSLREVLIMLKAIQPSTLRIIGLYSPCFLKYSTAKEQEGTMTSLFFVA